LAHPVFNLRGWREGRGIKNAKGRWRGKEERIMEGKEAEGRNGKGKGRKREEASPPIQISVYATAEIGTRRQSQHSRILGLTKTAGISRL